MTEDTIDGFTKVGKINKTRAAELAKGRVVRLIPIKLIWFGGARCSFRISNTDTNEPVILQKLDRPLNGKVYVYVDGNHRLEHAKVLKKMNIRARVLTTKEVDGITELQK